MTAIAAVGVVLAFLIIFTAVLLFFLVCRLIFKYDSDTGEISLFFEALFVKFRIYPKDPVKARKKKIKAELKKAKKRKKEKKKILRNGLSDIAKDAHAVSDSGEKKPTLSEKASHLSEMLKKIAAKIRVLVPGIMRSISLEIRRLDIVVGGEDAAESAVSYGTVCAGVDMLFAIGEECRRFTVGDDVFVAIDYGGEKIRAEIELIIRVRAYKALIAVLRAM